MAIRLADADDLRRAADAGRAVNAVLATVRAAALPGSTPATFAALAQRTAADLGASCPPDAPAVLSVCRGPVVVPSRTALDPRPLLPGELITLDVYLTRSGRCADAAISHPVPGRSPSADGLRVRAAARSALAALLHALRPGVAWRDCLLAARAAAARHAASLADWPVAHGLGTRLHEHPFLPADPDAPAAAQPLLPGMVLAVEPAAVLGAPAVVALPDGSVRTVDGGPVAFEERTIAITPAGPVLLAGRPGPPPPAPPARCHA